MANVEFSKETLADIQTALLLFKNMPANIYMVAKAFSIILQDLVSKEYSDQRTDSVTDLVRVGRLNFQSSAREEIYKLQNIVTSLRNNENMPTSTVHFSSQLGEKFEIGFVLLNKEILVTGLRIPRS